MLEHLEAVLLGGAREHQPEHDDRLVHDGNAQRKGTGRRKFICNDKTTASINQVSIVAKMLYKVFKLKYVLAKLKYI